MNRYIMTIMVTLTQLLDKQLTKVNNMIPWIVGIVLILALGKIR